MGEKLHTYKHKFVHMEVGHSPTCGTNAVHLLPASDLDVVSGFPTTCFPYHLTIAESVRYIWCLWKAPIMLQDLPLSSKGVAKFINFYGPLLAMKFTIYNAPPWSHGLHKHGEIMHTIRK